MVNKELSVCILGKGNTKYLSKCIEYASKISREVLYIDLDSDDQSKSNAAELGVLVVDLDSFTSALPSEWVLFIKPEERAVVPSAKKFQKVQKNSQIQGYGVYANSTKTRRLLEDYQWVRKLEQFKNVRDSDCVHTIEPRLVRKSIAKSCLESLVSGDTEGISWVCEKIAPGITIKPICDKEPDNNESPEDHDIRCLKGKLTYDVTPEEDMVEFSEMYTGFRILHKGQLDGFMEGARRGFGHIKMYIPLLDFLCKEGFFEEAKNLFEQWIEHRPDDTKNFNVQLMGAMIYSNLLEIDKAIDWFGKITETSESALACANLGKLYLIKGDKQKAIECLEKSKDVKGDIFLKQRILPIIDRDDWQPLTLSLCMIARDEEAMIEKALQSVDGIADEIIVVDTGSSDKTREIVREYNGKIFETKWKNDFSKAKNFALEQATGDYILFMDADEFIDSRDRFALDLFKKLLPIERNIAFGLKVEPAKESKSLSMSYLDRLLNREEDDYQIRLFPTER
jgi:pentatricopeptide repeat protein